MLGWLSGVVLSWGPLARSTVLAGPASQARFREQGWGQAWSLDPGSQPGQVNGSPRSAGGKGRQGEWSGCAATVGTDWDGHLQPPWLGLAAGLGTCWGWCLPAVPDEKSLNPLWARAHQGMVLALGHWAWSRMCCCSQPRWCKELLGLGVPSAPHSGNSPDCPGPPPGTV